MSYLLVRGMVGSGKTAASIYVADKLDALRLSTDMIAERLAFAGDAQRGQPVRTDNEFRAIRLYFHELMLAIARDHSPQQMYAEAYAGADDLCKQVIGAPIREFLRFDSRKKTRVYDLLNEFALDTRKNVVCESPFTHSAVLKRFLTELYPAPYLIEVNATDKTVETRLNATPLRLESVATLDVYKAMKRTWKGALTLKLDDDGLRWPRERLAVVNNNYSRRQLEEKVDLALKDFGMIL